MEILLAGHTLDFEIIRQMAAEHPDRRDLTPETVAAAYARISRNPKPVNELRALARAEVEKARASNRTIVFEMGHSSIAEHAVFNLDVLGVSRLLVEAIEGFRLASYTEKSQRYVLLQDDFVLPEEIRRSGLADLFTETIRLQNEAYHRLYDRLRPHVFNRHPDLASDPANRSMIEGWAKEDARYVISLATLTQLGMTANARTLELMIRRLAASPLAEAREGSRRLFEAVKTIAPSLVRYTEPTPYDLAPPKALGTRVEQLIGAGSIPPRSLDGTGAPLPEETVRLIEATAESDGKVAAALLHGVCSLSLAECRRITARLSRPELEALFKAALGRMKAYDAAPRAFEQVALLFELTISATCFAQIKRHRMASLTVQPYDPSLGVTVPPSIREIGQEGAFREICARTEETWERIRRVAPEAAPYILTNAHRRRVVMGVNARELYHLARVRSDRHAQWDIRETVDRMTAEGRKAMPLTLLMAAGKDAFEALYARTFGETP